MPENELETTLESAFEAAWIFTKRWEGGYTNDPVDPGGETNYGISKRAFPKEDIANLTEARARELYLEIWKARECGRFSCPLSVVYFDACFNHSPRAALKMLEASDGLWERLLLARIQYYLKLVNNSPALGKFLKGWIARASALFSYADALEKTQEP